MSAAPAPETDWESQPEPERSKLRTLARGATMACPVCGRRRGLFHRWVKMVDACPRCNLRFERDEGHFVGAVGTNTILSFGLLLIGLIAFFIATAPDIPTGPWVFGAAAAFTLVPVILYPVSKTLWTAIDLVMRPLEPGETLPRERW